MEIREMLKIESDHTKLLVMENILCINNMADEKKEKDDKEVLFEIRDDGMIYVEKTPLTNAMVEVLKSFLSKKL